MTNKEAIEILISIKNTPCITWENDADIALDLAIKALEANDKLLSVSNDVRRILRGDA